MPASRWQTNFNDLLQWSDEEENELLSLMMPSMISRSSNQDSGDAAETEAPQTSTSAIDPNAVSAFGFEKMKSTYRALFGVVTATP